MRIGPQPSLRVAGFELRGREPRSQLFLKSTLSGVTVARAENFSMVAPKCGGCGAVIIPTANFCPSCGAPLRKPSKKSGGTVTKGCGGCLIVFVVLFLFVLVVRVVEGPLPPRNRCRTDLAGCCP